MKQFNLFPVADTSCIALDELFSRFQELDTKCLLIYLFDKVEESALIHLAEQFHITGYEGEKPFLILDDPFVNLDDEKQAAGMQLLASVAQEYQVIYFTCHTSRVPAAEQAEG